MPAPVPTKFFKSTVLLLEVPRSEFLDVARCEDPLNESSRNSFFKLLRGQASQRFDVSINHKQKYRRRFNAAAWLSFNRPPDKPVALMLSYRDSKGEFSVIVDESNPDGSGSMMLSGEVTLEFYGELKYLRACCTGIAKTHGFFLDEVHVHRITTKVAGDKGQSSIAS
ncbi:hypothetical protein [Litoribacillus peritrichatus]|uniref:Uncharacterized protein n=1 Tax=Litoribacillus peritrichatus TaxID=718191 RepID=A0ABP7MBN0_9GAMM